MVEAVEIKQEETTEEKPVEQTKVEEVKRPEGLPEKFNSVEIEKGRGLPARLLLDL